MTDSEQESIPEEIVPEEVIAPAESIPPAVEEKPEAPPVVPAYVPVPPPSRLRRILRSAARWAGVALVGFLVGLAVMAYPLLRAQASLNNVEKERDQMKFTLALQNKMLSSLQNDQARLIVLRALSELRAAKLALADQDEINLPLFIDKAAQVMKAAPDTLLETQQATVTKIQQKLALAQEKAKSNLRVTQADLDVLLAETIENLRNLDALLNPNP